MVLGPGRADGPADLLEARGEIILLCVRWYLRYALSYRDLEEMMKERNLTVDHKTVSLRRSGE